MLRVQEWVQNLNLYTDIKSIEDLDKLLLTCAFFKVDKLPKSIYLYSITNREETLNYLKDKVKYKSLYESILNYSINKTKKQSKSPKFDLCIEAFKNDTNFIKIKIKYGTLKKKIILPYSRSFIVMILIALMLFIIINCCISI